ncbi:MAG: alkaline phosphatase [Gammaproteobacteria bacterium]|nr:alkaline phosphatase [Gammaproteobacteria bacterium]
MYNWAISPWAAVDEERDFTRRIALSGLEPATDYEIVVEARPIGGEAATSTLEGSFRTAPSPDVPARVVFTSVTGTDYEDQDSPEGGFRIHQAMMDLETDFFVHTGDIIYYWPFAKNIDLARWGWARMFSLDSVLEFHRRVPTYFMKDDHDTWQDDTWPTQESLFMGDLTFQDGVEVFREQMPIDGATYRTFRWGQDVQIWLVEGRNYRDANMDPDGPDKSIWGEEQKTWFKESVAESDATFRILISPTPLVGPDNPDKWDSHANEIWTYEGDELRQFLADNDMIVICGDRHWQYVSVDDETGLREYATGPASDAHAGGWNQGYRPEHRYLNVVGGFLSVTVDRPDSTPTMTLRHHSVDGDILNEDALVAN